jgi:hypothetical protein
LIGFMGWLRSPAAVSVASGAVASAAPAADALTSQIFLPVVRNGNVVIPVVGTQLYGYIGAGTGFTRVVESKISWVRFQVLWSDIEPVNTTPDHYEWNSLDASVQTAVNAGIHVILTLEANPAWAAPPIVAPHNNGPVTNTADLVQFVSAVVSRYPGVQYFEIYNEPDNQRDFGRNGAGYADMLTVVYPAVKAANPAANVVMAGIAMDWFVDEGGPFVRSFITDMLNKCQKNASPCFDQASFHYYPSFRWRWESYGRDVIGKASYLRQMMANYGYVRPIFVTEAGWPTTTEMSSSPEIQARYVPKVFVRAMAGDLPMVSWYAMMDTDWSNPGFLDSSLTPRPSYTTLQVVTELINQARFVRAIPSTETGSAQIEGYQFTAPGVSRRDVYWYDCPSMYNGATTYPIDCETSAVLKLGAAQVTRIDKFGNRTILTATGGYITLNVTSSPIFIDYP